MVELNAHQMDSVFHALGDATRRSMLRDLSRGERTVSQLAEPYSMSLAAASKHIKALENAGLIRREVRGRAHFCRLNPGPLASARDWLGYYTRFWTESFDRLEELLCENGVQTSHENTHDRVAGASEDTACASLAVPDKET